MDGNVIGTIAMNKKRIYGLEIFRILAAVGVLCYHYFFIGVIQGFYSKDVFIEFAFWGEFGVDIFFLISGFVIFCQQQIEHLYNLLVLEPKEFIQYFYYALFLR